MTWGDLFDRAAAVETTETTVRDALTARRERVTATADATDDPSTTDNPPTTADPTRVVADAAVLAADVLVGGAARRALDRVREHSWMTLVASDPLLADARAVIESVSGEPSLAADWLDRVRESRTAVDHPAGDHPAMASAYRGGAAHLLSFDGDLTSARTGLSVQPYVSLSVREPAAFAAVFDAAALYESSVGDVYPGPDRDPRA